MSQGSVVTPISLYLLGSGHHCPPFKCRSTLLETKLGSHSPHEYRGRQSIISSIFRKQPLTSMASVPPEGTVPMGHRRVVGCPTGVPHSILCLQGDLLGCHCCSLSSAKKKEDVQRSAVDVLVPSVCCTEKRKCCFKNETKGEEII